MKDASVARRDVYPIGKKNPNLPFHPAVRAGDRARHGTICGNPRPASRCFRCAPPGDDCVAGHVGLELRNVGKNYPFERSRRFPEIQPNSGHRDYSL
jgi:hypothetical protein